MLVPIITFMLVLKAVRQDINHGLPNYIKSKNLGIFSLCYTGIRMIAPVLIFMSIPTFGKSWWLFLLGIMLYVIAYGIKIVVRHMAYGAKPRFNLLM